MELLLINVNAWNIATVCEQILCVCVSYLYENLWLFLFKESKKQWEKKHEKYH